MKQSTVAIVGMNSTGAACAFSLLMKNYATQLLLVDPDADRNTAEFLDLSSTYPISATSKITQASYAQAARADIIIIANAQTDKTKPSVSKEDIDDICLKLTPLNPNAIIIIASDPVDAITLYIHKKKLLPQGQVIGIGTLLDTLRLQALIGEKLTVSPCAIHGFILGGASDSQFTAWSSVLCDGKPVASFQNISENDLTAFEQHVKNTSHYILAHKGAAAYGIAICITLLCESIIFDQKKIFPVSCFYEPFNLCLSLPCIIGSSGVDKIMTISLSTKEKTLLTESAEKIRQSLNVSHFS